MTTQTMTSFPALIGRVYWMIIGPFALAICFICITEQRDGWFSPLDWVFWALLGAMILSRWLEFRNSQVLTAMGEPATMAHIRQYALVLGILGLAAWLAGNLLGNHSLRSLG